MGLMWVGFRIWATFSNSAVLRREGDRELALFHSGDLSSIAASSSASTSDVSFSHEESLVNIPTDYSDLTLDHSEWKAMLPPDKQIVVWRSAFLSFFLDPTTGKNCFMLGIEKFLLLKDWAVQSHPESRFKLVAVPRYSVGKEMMIDMRGRIKTQMLSPGTLYASYLVFQLRNKDSYLKLDSTCFMSSSVRFMHDTESDYDYSERQDHDHQTWVSFRQGNDRDDGWMEIKLGDIYVDQGSQGMVEARFMGRNGFGMEDLVEGIEFRPQGFPISALFMKPADEVGKRKNRKGKGIFSYFRTPST